MNMFHLIRLPGCPLYKWLNLAFALLFIQLTIPAVFSASSPSADPFFRNNIEIWLDNAPTTEKGIGTEDQPFHVGTAQRFDSFMRSFKSTPNVTFLLKPGVYFTSGTYESRSTNEFGTFWEPYHGWRILGSGIDSTFLVLTNVPRTFYSTKFQVIGNINSYGSGYIEHVEVAHMTIDANGYELLKRNAPIGPSESNFGCVFFQAGFVHLHDLKCIGAHRAMRPDGLNVGKSTECFILGISAPADRAVTNNIIEFCHVINPDTNRNTNNPTQFTSKNNDITTAIVISASPQSRTNLQAYTYYPQLRFCHVEGNGYDTAFNALGMFGCVEGFVISNSVHHARNGFYNDDGILTPSLGVIDNQLSDVALGIYWNHAANRSRNGHLAVEGNRIELCRDCLPPNLTFTTGVSAAGNPDGLTFQSLYIGGNYISSVQNPPPADLQDFGLNLGNVRKAYIEANLIALGRRQNSSRITYPGPAFRSQIQLCHNLNLEGRILAGYDMTSGFCQNLNTNLGNLDIPECTLDEVCLNTAVRRAEFPMASVRPKPLVYPPAINDPNYFIAWEAERGEFSGDFSPVQSSNHSDNTALLLNRTNTNLAFGKVRYRVHIPNAGRYYLWSRLYSGKSLRTTYDVEIDGERRWFLAAVRPDPIGQWTWFVVNELIQPTQQDTRPRILFFQPGWHEITFYARHIDTGIDALCLTTVPPSRLAINDALALHLENVRDSAAILAIDCPWETQIEAESMNFDPPIRSSKDPGPLQPTYISSNQPDRGRASATFQIPRSDSYRIFLRMRPRNAVYNSVTLHIDGRPWIVTAPPTNDWSWSSHLGNTEAEAISDPIPSLRLSNGPHTLEISWREPDVAIDQIFIEAAPHE